jgi:ligand-binding sensor domain-containing protein
MLVSVALSVAGQQNNYYFKSYSIRDGLPNNHVRWITQDKDGFLWIATWDGLSRFDGIEFKTYRHDPNDSNSVSFFEIVKVVVDSNNQVWVFAGGRLCRYERNHDHFLVYGAEKLPSYVPTGHTDHFHNILIDPGGNLVVAYSNGFFRYNNDSDRFDEIKGLEALMDKYQFSLPAFDKNGNLWYLRVDPQQRKTGKVFKCSYAQNKAMEVLDSFLLDQDNFRELFTNESVHAKIHLDSSGNVWFATSHGLFRADHDTIRSHTGPIPGDLFRDREIILWSQPGRGLMIHYPAENYTDTLLRPGEIETVIAYYYDAQNNIWFSDMNSPSARGGLYQIFRTGNFFRHYLITGEVAGRYAIFGLNKDHSGNIWAGGRPNNHLVRISPDGLISRIELPFHPVSHNHVPRNMSVDANGDLWIAFFRDYLYKLDPETMIFTDFSGINSGNRVAGEILYRLVQPLDKKRMITAGGGKIYVFNPATREIIHTKTPNSWDMYCICPDPSGQLWIGLSGRLLKCDADLKNQELVDISRQLYNIEDMCPGDSADLWLALLGGGICRYNRQSGDKEFITTFNGLAHNTVYGIKRDNSGNLWVSHNMGISMFNPVTKSFINYDKKDGLLIEEFNSEAVFQGKDGELIFGGMGGIVSFYPDSVEGIREDSPAGLIISGIKVSNKVFFLDQSVNTLKSLELPKGTDNFQMEFIRPDFRYGDEARYRYKLEGNQENWIYADSKHRTVNFTSLRPGRYEFYAESTDLKGDWKYATSLVITIPPYLYQTLFFKLVMIAISVVIFLLIFMMKLKQIQLNERKVQEQLKLETLRGQMNPHFIYNSLNSINYFISLNDRLNANQYITDFSRLMRAIMINSSQDYITLESEIQAIRDYLELEHLRFSNKFDFEMTIAENIDQVTTEITPSLVQPFIENAIWHGLRYLENRKGFLSVKFLLENNISLVCYVEDDGVGRRLSVKLKTGEQRKRRSRGIAIVEERLALINSFQKTKFSATISNLYDDREETGTRIRIELPFRKP